MHFIITMNHSHGSTPVEVTDWREDADLLRRIAAQDRKAFEKLYHRYAPRLGSYLMRLLRQRDLVDEAVNDTLYTVWQSAARFDPQRARVSTWLFGIAYNKGLKALARAAPRTWVPLEDSGAHDENDNPDTLASHDNPEHSAMGEQLGQSLADALAALSPEHRSVIELAFIESMSYEDIALVMDCPVNTVKTRMFHARKKLSERLTLNEHA
jgi:RNA polymerase sigma-70 factor (ECF subfamily)